MMENPWKVSLFSVIGVSFTLMIAASMRYLTGSFTFDQWMLIVVNWAVPLLSFAGFIAVYLGFQAQEEQNQLLEKQLNTQNARLDNQQRNFERRRFENTFFQLTELRNEVVDSISFTDRYGVHYLRIPEDDDIIHKILNLQDMLEHEPEDSNDEFQGRDAFPVLRRLTECFIADVYFHQKSGQYIFTDDPGRFGETNLKQLATFLENEATADEKRELIDDGFDRFWQNEKFSVSHKVGQYFRNVEQSIKLIQSIEKDRDAYVKLLRSQMSDEEINLLAYYGLSEHGNVVREAIAELQVVHPVSVQYELINHFLLLYDG